MTWPGVLRERGERAEIRAEAAFTARPEFSTIRRRLRVIRSMPGICGTPSSGGPDGDRIEKLTAGVFLPLTVG